jgi:capsular polysaccharide biosynthesis protein
MADGATLPETQKELHLRVALMAEAGDPAGVIALLAELPSARFTSRLLIRLSTAAAQAGSAAAARQAALVAVSAELAPEERATIARRLATPSLRAPDLAWAVLAADPAAMLAPAAEAEAIRALGGIADGDDPLLRAAAGAARRRLLRVAPARFEALPPPGPLPPWAPPAPVAPLRLLRAPGLPPAAEESFRGFAEAFERELARPPGAIVRVLRDVFVNAAGQVWLADGQQVLDGLNGGPPAPIPPASRAAMAAAPRVDDAEYATLRPNAGNFFHWMINNLPALSRHAGAEAAPTLLVGRPAPGFVAESLALAGADWPLLPAGDATFVARLAVGWAPVAALAQRGAGMVLHDRLAAAADAGAPPADAAPLLYISRRDSGFRALGNEAALEAALAERGFATVAFQGRPLIEQLRIIRAARLIVAPHGAGLAHLAFARPGVAVLELMPLVTSLSLRFQMARISRVMGHRHALWLAPSGAANRWTVDLDALLPEVERLAGGVADSTVRSD